MNTAITIGDALLLLVGVCVVILLIYMIRAVKNIIPAFKALSGILEDTQVVTGMVSSASKEVEDAPSRNPRWTWLILFQKTKIPLKPLSV